MGGGRESAALVALIYLISPSVQGFANAEFVPLDFVPLLAFGLALALTIGSTPLVLVTAELLCGTKEDVGLFVGWFGIIYAFFGNAKTGAIIAAVAAANLFVYYGLVHGFSLSTVHPSYSLVDNNWPKQLAFLIEILAPFAFAPLALGWRILLVAPVLWELFFAKWAFPLYQAGSYYTIVLVSIVVLASAYVLAKNRLWSRVAIGCAVVMAVFFNTTVLHIGRRWYSCDPLYGSARAWSFTRAKVDFPCEDQGAWTVAAGDPNARLIGCGHHRKLGRAREVWANQPLASTSAWTRGPR